MAANAGVQTPLAGSVRVDSEGLRETGRRVLQHALVVRTYLVSRRVSGQVPRYWKEVHAAVSASRNTTAICDATVTVAPRCTTPWIFVTLLLHRGLQLESMMNISHHGHCSGCPGSCLKRDGS